MRNNKARKALLVVGVALSAALLVGWSWEGRDKREDRKAAREERGASAKGNDDGVWGRWQRSFQEEKELRQFERAKDICKSLREGDRPLGRQTLYEILELATPAAQNGNSEAQSLLGDCYSSLLDIEGRGTDSSRWGLESAKWFLKSAKSGNRYAQWRISMCFLEGIGVPKDLESAYKWAREANIPLWNGNIQLQECKSGIALEVARLPPSHLTIDVEGTGEYKMFDEYLTLGQIRQLVADRCREFDHFPFLIRADKHVAYRHVAEVVGAYRSVLLDEKQNSGRPVNPAGRVFLVNRQPVDDMAYTYATLSVRCLPSPSLERAEEIALSFRIEINPRFMAFNGRAMSFDQLDRAIQKITAGSARIQLIISCAQDAPYGSLLRMLDLCNRYHVAEVALLSGDCHGLGQMDSPNVSPMEDADKFDSEIEEVMQEESPQEEPPPPAEVEPPQEIKVDDQIDPPLVSQGDMADIIPSPGEAAPGKLVTVDALCNIKSTMKLKSVAGTARSTGMRGDFLKGGKMYGDATTERAVLKALRWLKATQAPDGSWGTKPELGLTKGMDKAAGAGFAVLTFLAHGETPASKEFGPTVEKALNYLINNVYVVKDKAGNEVKDPNGLTPYVKMRGAGGSEYGYLIGTYALCEAYAMTKNPNARAAAEKALSRIISGQTPTGGWNYNMKRASSEGAPDDISFGGWAMQALKAGKMAGIHLPGMEECIKKAVKCLQTRNYSEKAGFVYRATNNHKGGGGGLAGVGCLAMQLLGYANAPEVANALEVMKGWAPSLDAQFPYMKYGTLHNPQYYCYYATQCKYQAGMARSATPANIILWQKWNTEMKKLYPRSIITVMDPKTNKPYTIQDAKGIRREIGHWVNQDYYNYDVMGTCLAALQLMVYYRYLPTTQLKAAEVAPDVESCYKEKTGEVNVEVDI